MVLAIALAAVLVAVAFAPVVQTWLAQLWLDRQASVHGSVEAFSAHFGKLEVHNLKLKFQGAQLALPSLQAELPLTTAFVKRRFLMRRLVAKGWTLDLREALEAGKSGNKGGAAPKAEGAAQAQSKAGAVPAQTVARVFRGILSSWSLPCDVSLDGADLEGDIVLPAPVGTIPTRVHVAIKGGGMAPGREGSFTFDASSGIIDAALDEIAVTGHGRLAVAMATPRTLGRVEANSDITATGGPFPNGLVFHADVAAALGDGGEDYSVDVSRNSQHLAVVVVHWPEASRRFAGTLKLDFGDSDVALFTKEGDLPHFTATGEGKFDSDLMFSRIHAAGRLKTSLSGLDILMPWPDGLGTVSLDANFDGTEAGHVIHLDRLKARVAVGGPAAVVEALQPFDINEHTGGLKPLNPAADWMDVSVSGIPLAWFFDSSGNLTLSGGGATGEFIVRTDKGGYAARSKSPLTAENVSVQTGTHTLARKLNLSLSLAGDYSAQQWHFRASPLVIGSGGVRLATIDAKGALAPGADQPAAITGTWSADLQALAAKAVAPELYWIRGRSASGDFSAKVGDSTQLDGKFTVLGHDQHHSITAGVHAELDTDGRISFRGPVKLDDGSGVTDLSTDATWLQDRTGAKFYMKLTGKEVSVDHLRLIAATLAEAGGAHGVPIALTRTPSSVRDRVPFWGNWSGRVLMEFGQVKAGEYLFKNAGGAFQVDHNSLRLEGGHGELGDERFSNVTGSIAFDAASERPYGIKAKATLDKIEAGSLFLASDYPKDPPFEGRFSMEAKLEGKGNNLADLIGRAQERFQLTSTAGIVRFLKTDVDEAIPPEKEIPVAEDLGRVGSGFGSIFGVNSIGSGKRKVSPAVETVIEFINDVSEIGYDQVALNAVRGPDGTIQLNDILLKAHDIRLTGAGQIGPAKGLPLRACPLSVDLQFRARGIVAKLLAKAGLLSAQKDKEGYRMLIQPIHLGGTLEHIDRKQWHELLLKAAEKNPVPVVAKKAP
jgi:hypothetical protein